LSALLQLFDTVGEFNRAELLFLSHWSPFTLFTLVLLLLLIFGLSLYNLRGRPWWQRRWLLLLRLLTLLLLTLLSLQPGLRLENVSRVRNHVAFLLDDSRSMSLPGEGGESRLEGLRVLLKVEAERLEAWRQIHQLDFYALSDHARPLSGPEALRGRGEASHLLSGLDDLAARFQPEELAAVILISDGAANGILGGVEELPAAAQQSLKRLGAPTHTLFSGPQDAPKDVAIAQVLHDDFAFVRNTVSVEVELKLSGYEGLRLPLTLREGERVLGTRMLRSQGGEEHYRLEFEFVPEETGKHIYSLELGQAPEEEILANNRAQFVIRIIRDKIRVLQVVGRPSWDQRFLRKLLKKNPNVDLISFFILRTSASINVAGRDELSLIPFPTQELFERQLGSFDLIIFQNFTHLGYHMRHYLPLIRDYVRDGGGFVMLGGDQSFSAGGYAGTAVEELLPVQLPVGREELLDHERFRPMLTSAGQRHPITALSLLPEENKSIWAKLPELSGLNRVSALKPRATALLRHPKLQVDGEGAPVVAVMPYGEGRVLSVATDSSWRWDFLAAGAGGDNRHYYSFWGNAIRWLIRDPDLQPIRLEADRDHYPLDAEVSLMARVLGRDYQPAAQVPLTLTIERAGSDALREELQRQEGHSDEHGEWGLSLKPKEGAYFLRLEAELEGGSLAAQEVFVVAPDPLEMRETAPRPKLLERIAKAGGGEARLLSQGLKDLERTEPKVIKVNRRRDVALWSTPWLLLLGILFPSLEWYLRRRWGLL